MDFTAAHFAAPHRLWFLVLALVGLGALFARSHFARQRQLASFADPGMIERLLASHSPLRRAIKVALIFLAVILLGRSEEHTSELQSL